MARYRSVFAVHNSFDAVMPRVRSTVLTWMDDTLLGGESGGVLDGFHPGMRFEPAADVELIWVDEVQQSGDHLVGFVVVDSRDGAEVIHQVMIAGGPRDPDVAVISLEVGGEAESDGLTPVPGYVRSILAEFTCDDYGIILSATPTLCREDGVASLCKELDEIDQHVQVAVAGSGAGLPLVQWRALVGRIFEPALGLTAVYVLDDAATITFNARAGVAHQVPAGSIRVFAPGVEFGQIEDADRHAFVPAVDLVHEDTVTAVSARLCAQVAEFAATQALSRRERRYLEVLGAILDDALGAYPLTRPGQEPIEAAVEQDDLGLEEVTADHGSLEEELDALRAALDAERRQKADQTTVIAEMTAARGRLLAVIEDLRSQLGKARATSTALAAKAERLAGELAHQRREAEEDRTSLDGELREAIENLRTELHQAHADLEDARAQTDEVSDELRESRERGDRLEGVISSTRAEVGAANRERDRALRELDDWRIRAQAAERALRRQGSDLSSSPQARSRPAMVPQPTVSSAHAVNAHPQARARGTGAVARATAPAATEYRGGTSVPVPVFTPDVLQPGNHAYKPWTVRVQRSGTDLRRAIRGSDAGIRGELVAVVENILGREAPVSQSRLLDLVRDTYGQSRLTDPVREALWDTLVGSAGIKQDEFGFVWATASQRLPGHVVIQSARRHPLDHVKDLSDVHPCELAIVVDRCNGSWRPVSRTELYRRVLREVSTANRKLTEKNVAVLDRARGLGNPTNMALTIRRAR